MDKRSDPAAVVLPTWKDAAETLLVTQIFKRLRRDDDRRFQDSAAIRQSGKFETLGIPPVLNIAPGEIAVPRVALPSTVVRLVEDARRIYAEANVIVTLSRLLAASKLDAGAALIVGASDRMIDEAHHVTAATLI